MQALKVTTPVGFTSPFARSWDQSNAASGPPAIVRNISTGPGTFDWSRFDLFFANNAGKKIIFTLGQPADWMISRAALGGALYGGKGNMCPTGATELSANYLPVVQAMVTRARDVFGVTGIHWELWNEIHGSGMLAVAERPALGPMAKAIGPAIKAVDPTAVILSPSSGDESAVAVMSSFLTASDGATGKGGDYVDGLAFHYYSVNSPWAWKRACDAYRLAATLAGYPSLPLWVTESGMLKVSDTDGKELQRRILVFAACGCKAFIGYAVDSLESPLGAYSALWNEAVAAVAGKTITNCTKHSDGSVSVIADGVTTRF